MEEVNYTDSVGLFCSVLTNGGCKLRVEWLYDGDKNDVEISTSSCSSSVMFPTPCLNQKSEYYKFLKCKVRDEKSGNTLLYDVCTWFSCEKKGRTSEENNMITTEHTEPVWWLWILIVSVSLAALLIITVVVIRRKITKRTRTQTGERIGLGSNQAATPPVPETSPAVADPEEGVSYASISHTRKAAAEAQVRNREDDDDDDAVTYSIVKSPSSAGASPDFSNLYATLNKPNE